jgi:hypothetical protein
VQTNLLSTALMAFLLYPLLEKTAKETGSAPRLVVTNSDTHLWKNIPRAAIDSGNIVEYMSGTEYCTHECGP